MSPACAIASAAAITARRSLRDIRFASRRPIGSIASTSALTSAARSVGKVSPGKRVSLAMFARDSRIDRHTSSLLRPIEQMIPAPVRAMRIEGSGVLMAGSGKSKPAARDVYSINRAARGEAKETAELGVEPDGDVHDIAHGRYTIEHQVVDAAEEPMLRRIEDEPAGELRHGLGEEERGVLGGAHIVAFDGAVIDARAGARGAE